MRIPAGCPPPRRLYDYEIGYSFTGNRIRAGANVYYMRYHDQLVLTGEINNVGEAIMVNVPDSYRAGIELTAGITILKSLTWDLNAAFSPTRSLTSPPIPTTTMPAGTTLGRSPENLGKTNLSFSPGINIGSTIRYMPVKGLTISLYSKYIGRQYIDNTSTKSRSLDPWFVNNLGANM